MIRQELLALLGQDLDGVTIDKLYHAVNQCVQNKMKNIPHVSGDRTLYYMSAEFLIGKLLSNNLMNLGIYDEVKEAVESMGYRLSDLEEYEPEPSLGNGGLGRLAACFLDSIATLGLNGEGLGLNYHFGLFKQVFGKDHFQHETKDVWLEKPSWLTKTDFTVPVTLGSTSVIGRMYNLDILGYNGEKTTLRLFDLESVDETLVGDGIQFNLEAIDKNLTLFLYPDDSTDAGKRLRFIQQYFMVKCNLAWVLSQHEAHIETLHEHVAIQLNDTHPVMVIPMLALELEKRGNAFDKIVEIVTKTCAYTNHTILAEALETWPISYFETIDRNLSEMIWKLDREARSRSKDPFIGIVGYYYIVHMAALACNFSHSINGVAALHTEILKKTTLKSFYELYPERFNNKTNGITFRRWLQFSNRELTSWIESKIGEDFTQDAMSLVKLEAFKDDKEALQELLDIKHLKKQQCVDYIYEISGRKVNVNSIFDIQIKRLHEYKRQQMNLLYIIYLYLRIKDGVVPKRPITFFFGSKAAPAYVIAKDIIHALLVMQTLIESDEDVRKHIQIVFVENYNVTKAEMLIPACDVSEQISLASKEASGTGNMKLMLNGALTLGTLDGANVEIAEHVGDESIYIFGKHSDEVIDLLGSGSYNPRAMYENTPWIRRCVDFLTSEPMRNIGTFDCLNRLRYHLVDHDPFMTLLDFEDYVWVKNEMFEDYENRMEWASKMMMNIANAGFFSSDRTIASYNQDIWNLK